MPVENSISHQIFALEESLLAPEVRIDPGNLMQLLSDDFIEFGSSGHKYDKQDVIEVLPRASGERFSIQEFEVRSLAPGLALATYRAGKFSDKGQEAGYSLRSSIWRFEEDRWRMVFHQGTPVDI